MTNMGKRFAITMLHWYIQILIQLQILYMRQIRVRYFFADSTGGLMIFFIVVSIFSLFQINVISAAENSVQGAGQHYFLEEDMKQFVATCDHDAKKYGALNPSCVALPFNTGAEAVQYEALAFSPDGMKLAFGSNDGVLRIQHLDSQKVMLLSALKGEPSITSLSYASDGIVVGRGKQVTAFLHGQDERSFDMQEVLRLTGRVLTMKTRLKNKEILTGSEDGAYMLWDTTTGKAKRALVASSKKAASAITYIDDNTVACGGANNAILIFDVRKAKPVHTLKQHKATVSSLAFDESDRKQLISGSHDSTVAVWDVGNKVCKRVLLGTAPISAVAAVPFAQKWSHCDLLSGNIDGIVRRYKENTPMSIDMPTLHHKARVAAIDASNCLQASVGHDGRLMLCGVITKKLMTDLSLDRGGLTCSICLGEYEDGQEFVTLACMHNFHKSCIDPWLAIQHNCPNCRKLHVGAALPLAKKEEGSRGVGAGAKDKSSAMDEEE